MTTLPLIDVRPLFGEGRAARERVADEIGAACRDHGFFYAQGHGVDITLIDAVREAASAFFALPLETKMQIAMARAGRTWRGYFPVGGELTSGKPDLKEGIYFGEELGPGDARARANLPMHGANLFPAEVPALKPLVLDYIERNRRAAHAIMEGVALSLDLPASYFRDTYTRDPTILFRIFRYPPAPPGDESWGVGEHTDYGLLTLLAQDDVGGLQVKTARGWIDAPPIKGALVCNIGDMLDRLTAGAYKSTPHRVRNESGRERLSLPFFFDPGFDAEIVPLPHLPDRMGADNRWDGADLREFSGPYGKYLLGKVAKVFPALVTPS